MTLIQMINTSEGLAVMADRRWPGGHTASKLHTIGVHRMLAIGGRAIFGGFNAQSSFMKASRNGAPIDAVMRAVSADYTRAICMYSAIPFPDGDEGQFQLIVADCANGAVVRSWSFGCTVADGSWHRETSPPSHVLAGGRWFGYGAGAALRSAQVNGNMSIQRDHGFYRFMVGAGPNRLESADDAFAFMLRYNQTVVESLPSLRPDLKDAVSPETHSMLLTPRGVRVFDTPRLGVLV